MSRYSHAIGNGINSIDTWLETETSLPEVVGPDGNVIPQILDGLYDSSKQLHFTSHILDLTTRLGSQDRYRNLITKLLEIDDFFEHLAAHLGLEALYRAEEGVDRLIPLLQFLPKATPPEGSKRFLEGAASCYLLGLDDQCIVMCRAALEVIVEELEPSLDGERLGEAIRKLVPKRISATQADEMHEINRQAREILHRTPHRRPPSARECLERLMRLLAQLYPAAE